MAKEVGDLGVFRKALCILGYVDLCILWLLSRCTAHLYARRKMKCNYRRKTLDRLYSMNIICLHDYLLSFLGDNRRIVQCVASVARQGTGEKILKKFEKF